MMMSHAQVAKLIEDTPFLIDVLIKPAHLSFKSLTVNELKMKTDIIVSAI